VGPLIIFYLWLESVSCTSSYRPQNIPVFSLDFRSDFFAPCHENPPINIPQSPLFSPSETLNFNAARLPVFLAGVPSRRRYWSSIPWFPVAPPPSPPSNLQALLFRFVLTIFPPVQRQDRQRCVVGVVTVRRLQPSVTAT
jgi:hypothetical protein